MYCRIRRVVNRFLFSPLNGPFSFVLAVLTFFSHTNCVDTKQSTLVSGSVTLFRAEIPILLVKGQTIIGRFLAVHENQ